MAAPVEPPSWEDEAPESVLADWALTDALASYDAALLEPDDGAGGWIDDELWLEIETELDGGPTGPQGPGWAVPGLDATGSGEGDGGGGDGGRLSAGSVAVLAELAAAWQAQRLAQARCYRALSALQASDALAESGYRYTSRLLAEHVRVDTTEALRLTRHAHDLTATTSPSGSVIPATLPATAGQVTDGVIGPGHVEVIRTTMARLERVTPAIDADTLTVTERELAGLAATLTPAALTEAAAAICARLDPDGTAPDDQPPPDNELHYLRRRDGSLVGKFTYRDPAAAETLHTALGAATPPADVPEPPPADGVGPRAEPAATHAERTLAERRAHGLLDLAGEALTHGLNTDDNTLPGDTPSTDSTGSTGSTDSTDGTDDSDDSDDLADAAPEPDDPPPATPAARPGPPAWTRADVEGGERVALTVTLNYETLRHTLTDVPLTAPGDGYTGRLALLGENTWIRPETARRLACDAEIIPLVLGTRGEPLDLGRKNRLVSAALRRAITQRDRHCAHPGCRRRARRCHAHHVHHWADGGQTCPENCVLLCTYHHTLIHHSSWQIHMIDGQPWFTPPAHIDPHRRPRHNRPWQLTGPTVA